MTERYSLHASGEVITPLAVTSAMHWAALLTPQPTQCLLKAPGMAAFSVFFCDQERCSIQPVWAMDPATPSRRCAAVCLICGAWRWCLMS
jgi:hypothetical protein